MNRFHRPSNRLPEGPPPEVLEEIDAAGERARALHEAGCELCFDGLSAVEIVAFGCGETVAELLGAAARPPLAA